jgi:hypothetical protein
MNEHNTGAGIPANPPGTPTVPQPALPFTSDYSQLSEDQLMQNLKQAWTNICAWPKQPTGGFHGLSPDGKTSVEYEFEKAHYAKSGIESEFTVRYHAAHGGKGTPTPTLKQRISSLGLDPNGDKNVRRN